MLRSSISGDNLFKPQGTARENDLTNPKSTDKEETICFDPKEVRQAILSSTNNSNLNELIRLIELSNIELVSDTDNQIIYEYTMQDQMHYRVIINEADHSLTMIEENLSSLNSAGNIRSITLTIYNSEFTVESYQTDTEGQISFYEIRNTEGRQVSRYKDGNLQIQEFYNPLNNMQNILLFVDGEDFPPVGNYHYELMNNTSVNNPQEYIEYLAERLNSYEKLAAFISNFMEYTLDEIEYWQPSIETVERISFGKMLGDCDDWAILARDILRLQGVNAHSVLVPGHMTTFWLEQDDEGNYSAYTLGTMGFRKNGERVDLNKDDNSERLYTDPMQATNSALGFFSEYSPEKGGSFINDIAAGHYQLGIENDMERLAVNVDVFTEPVYYEYFMAQYNEDLEQQRLLLEQIIETNPSTRYFRDLAVVYLRLDDQESFNLFFNQYRENENNPEQITNFILNIMKNGHKEFGLELISKLIEEGQAQPLLYLTYAVYCEDDAQARVILETAVEQYPDDQLINLANLHQDQLLSRVRRYPAEFKFLLKNNNLISSEQYSLLKFNNRSKEINIPN